MEAMTALLSANLVLALFSLANAVASIRCAKRAEADLRRVEAARHDLNLSGVYNHPRSIR